MCIRDSHSTVVIVGLGDIGYELAKRLKAFDCHITVSYTHLTSF